MLTKGARGWSKEVKRGVHNLLMKSLFYLLTIAIFVLIIPIYTRMCM